jgi:LPS-assembly protein
MRFYAAPASRADHAERSLYVNAPPLRLTSLSLALGLLWTGTVQAQEWNCRQSAQGEWICTGSDHPLTDTRRPLDSPPVVEPAMPMATPGSADATPVSGSSAPPVPVSPQATPAGPVDPAWVLCPPLPDRGLHFPVVADRELATTALEADRVISHGNERYELLGDAVIQRADQRVAADHILFDDLQRRVDATGQVRYDEPDLRLEAERARLLLDTDEGEIEPVDYRLYSAHARGSASILFLEGPDRKRMRDATYTTCAPGSDAWRLRASQVRLQQDEGMGVARHARLEVRNIPVFYTPYISFPIDDRRRSGFLIPGIGSSDRGGFDLRLPYYWNIAANRDATLTPRYMDKRGLMLDSEWRYLNRRSEGQLDLAVLPGDDAFGEDRHLFAFRHQGTLGERLRIEADLNDVSDAAYFNDFGESLEFTSITHLERRLDATYQGDWWRLQGRAQNFQTVDPAIVNRPYARLPQISFSARPPTRPFGVESSLGAEFTAFDHSRSSLVDTGNRLDLRPRLSLPLRRTAYEIIPALTIAHTRYDLERVDPTLDSSPSRTTPILSLDNRVYFERHAELFGHAYLQTLEPRAFYVYAPARDHSAIPLFDSGNRSFRFRELFTENRFTGLDRVGDANQLALAVTSRYLDPRSGNARLRASIGQLFYFEDREVTLHDTAPLENGQSDIAGELEVTLPGPWSLYSDALWNPDDGSTRQSNTGIHFRGGERRVANLSYRYTKGSLAQLDASWLWPLSRHWHLAGRWNYSLQDNRTLEALFGAEYDSCCWALRIAWRTLLPSGVTGEYDQGLYLEWELKGMSSLGDKVEDLMKSGILGYRP